MVTDKKSKHITATPTIDAAIYGSGDRLGSIITLTDAVDSSSDGAVLKTLIIVDSAVQSLGIDVLFFNALPTIGSADNAALSLTDAEMASKFIGRVVVVAADYTALALNSVAVKNQIEALMIPALGSRDLYCVLQARGTPTYGATTALTVKFLFEQY